MTLNGAGATFPAPLYQKWFESFQQRHPNAHINYGAVGSEAGLRLLMDGKVDFAASDVPLSDERMSQSKTTFLHFASVLGAVVPIYNLQGPERNLNFTAETLAGIYLGTIKKWNDPRIRESNRNVPLAESDIVVIHRSDGSGTTFVWTDYLSKVSPEWKATVGAGTVAKWPVGVGAEGNEGVAAMVQQTPNSIGYVELVYALRRQLSFGTMRNAAGQFVEAGLPSVTAAAEGVAGAMTSDFRVSITNAPGRDAYPIATFTWWLFPRELASGDKKSAFLELLQWVLTSGQKQCSALGYAPLPREIANRELQLLDSLK
jgi:phosphate transport system substrate-binding protein